jgi:hypothetical protein
MLRKSNAREANDAKKQRHTPRTAHRFTSKPAEVQATRPVGMHQIQGDGDARGPETKAGNAGEEERLIGSERRPRSAAMAIRRLVSSRGAMG